MYTRSVIKLEKKEERKQKTTYLYLLLVQPIYKTYHGQGIVIYAHYNPIQKFFFFFKKGKDTDLPNSW